MEPGDIRASVNHEQKPQINILTKTKLTHKQQTTNHHEEYPTMK